MAGGRAAGIPDGDQLLHAVVHAGAGEDAGSRITAHDDQDAASVRRSQLLVVGLFFFVYVALEVGFANWIHSYVEQIGYGDANTATGVTVIFWVGLLGGPCHRDRGGPPSSAQAGC